MSDLNLCFTKNEKENKFCLVVNGNFCETISYPLDMAEEYMEAHDMDGYEFASALWKMIQEEDQS